MSNAMSRAEIRRAIPPPANPLQKAAEATPTTPRRGRPSKIVEAAKSAVATRQAAAANALIARANQPDRDEAEAAHVMAPPPTKKQKSKASYQRQVLIKTGEGYELMLRVREDGTAVLWLEDEKASTDALELTVGAMDDFVAAYVKARSELSRSEDGDGKR